MMPHDLDEALDVLADIVGEYCQDEHGGDDVASDGSKIPYEAIRLLATHDRLTVTFEAGSQIHARWKEAELF